MKLLIDENLSPRLARWACEYGYPGVIALREAELNPHQQWARLKAALAFAEQTCGGDLLNNVLEVQAEDRFVLHTIPC